MAVHNSCYNKTRSETVNSVSTDIFFLPISSVPQKPCVSVSCCVRYCVARAACYYLRSSSFGWFLLSRLRSMRSDSRCLRTSVAYSSRPCRAVMISEATLPRSLMENERCISSVRMKVSRNTLLLMSCPNSFRAFSTFSWPFPDTWAEEGERERVLPVSANGIPALI